MAGDVLEVHHLAHHRAQQVRSKNVQRQILDAAVRVLIEGGYSNASTVRVQKEAGVSRGRLLHHFPSKDALFVAAVHHLAVERVRDTGNRTDWPAEPHERIGFAIDAMWSTYQQPYFWASIELWVVARSHEELRRALLPAEQKLGALVRVGTDNFFGPELCAKPFYPHVREVVNTSMRGVAMTYALDKRQALSDPHLDQWKSLAIELLLGHQTQVHQKQKDPT